MELSNYNKLDEYVTQNFSNAVDPVTAIAEGVGKTAEAMGKAKDANARKAETESRVGCIKPSIFAGKKKKQAYKECLSQYKQSISNNKSLDRQLELQKLKAQNDINQSKLKQSSSSGNKTLIIAGSLLVFTAIVTIGVIMYKRH